MPTENKKSLDSLLLDLSKKYYKSEKKARGALFVRVDLQERKKINIVLKGAALIKDARGNVIKLSNKSFSFIYDGNGKEDMLYYAILLISSDRHEAMGLANTYEREGYNIKVKERKIGNLPVQYILYTGPFKCMKDLREKSPSLVIKVVKQIGNAMDTPLLFVIDGKKYTLYGRIKIKNSGIITLKGVNNSNDLYSGATSSTIIKRDVEIIPLQSKLRIVSCMPIEEYVLGVVKSEIGEDAPHEAKKAQAVAARTNIIRRLWNSSGFSDYDIKSDVFSQVYNGSEDYSKETKRAVVETSGKILTYDGKPIEALFHAMCGGHTENSENVWSSYVPYLRGVLDEGKGHRSFPLSNEKMVRRWIDASPDVNCKKYGGRYWRWQFKYTPSQLGHIVSVKTGKYIGKVIDIKVLERGISGRAKKIEILGTLGYVVVNKDLDIRRALSWTSLPSSLFYVKKHAGNFIIIGRGFGHGVGMCQIGAMGMADKGYDYKAILKHYYKDVKLEKIY